MKKIYIVFGSTGEWSRRVACVYGFESDQDAKDYIRSVEMK